MQPRDDLVALYLSALRHHGGTPPQETQGLALLLAAHLQAGREVWPQVPLGDAPFIEHLARHTVEAPLGQIHGADLYLACACAHSLPAALSAFDESYLSAGGVEAQLVRLHPSPAFADEVRQLVRERLFLGDETVGAARTGKIAEYSGGGALRSWTRAVVLRTALNLRRQRELPGKAVDQGVLEALPAAHGPELEYLKRRYGKELSEAMQAAFMALPQEQRNVLRLHYAGGLSGDRIAALLQKSRATVVRWLSSARDGLFHETRRLLQERLQLGPDEFDSLLQMLRSQLDMSITTLLKESQGEGSAAK